MKTKVCFRSHNTAFSFRFFPISYYTTLIFLYLAAIKSKSAYGRGEEMDITNIYMCPLLFLFFLLHTFRPCGTLFGSVIRFVPSLSSPAVKFKYASEINLDAKVCPFRLWLDRYTGSNTTLCILIFTRVTRIPPRYSAEQRVYRSTIPNFCVIDLIFLIIFFFCGGGPLYFVFLCPTIL